MKDLTEWANADGSIPQEIVKLFRGAQPTRGMTEVERLRSGEAIRAIAATPAPTWPAIFTKNTLAVVLSMSTAGAFIGGGSHTKVLEEKHSATTIAAPFVSLAPEDEAPAPAVTAQNDVKPLNAAHSPPRLEEPTKKIPRIRVAKHTAPMEKPATEQPPPVVDAVAENNAPENGTTPDEDTLARELGLIEKARAALRTNPSETLELLNGYPKQFPAGRHVFTREVLTIDALLKLGRKAEARARAESLLPRVAGTPFEARVQKQWEEAK